MLIRFSAALLFALPGHDLDAFVDLLYLVQAPRKVVLRPVDCSRLTADPRCAGQCKRMSREAHPFLYVLEVRRINPLPAILLTPPSIPLSMR